MSESIWNDSVFFTSVSFFEIHRVATGLEVEEIFCKVNCLINIRRNWCYLTIILAFDVYVNVRVCLYLLLALVFHLDFLNSRSCRIWVCAYIQFAVIFTFFLTPMFSKCFIYAVTHSSMTQNNSSNEEKKEWRE